MGCFVVQSMLNHRVKSGNVLHPKGARREIMSAFVSEVHPWMCWNLLPVSMPLQSRHRSHCHSVVTICLRPEQKLFSSKWEQR